MANNATVNFFADSKDGSAVPVNAQIFVGDYSARSTQIADTDPATVNAGTNATGNLDNTAQFVPTGAGSLAGKNDRWTYYNFVAVAPGYGHVRFRVKRLEAGEVRNITIHFPTNYASATQGGTVIDRRSRDRDERDSREPDRRQRGHEQHPELHADRHLPRAGERSLGRAPARRDPRHRRRDQAARRLGDVQQPLRRPPLVRRVRVPRGQGGREPDLRRQHRRRVDAAALGTVRLVPGREPAAGHAGRVAALLRRAARRSSPRTSSSW